MFFLDLQQLLFGALLVLIGAVVVAIWLDRWWRRRRGMEAPFDAEEMRLAVERAPYGVLLLEGSHTCRYANPYAQELLELATPPCPLPEAEWVHLLNEDRLAARVEVTGGRYRIVSLPSERVVRWWVVPRENQDLVFLLDVTAHQRAEQAAQRLLSGLAHELRTPLGTILTHLEVLRLPDISKEIGQRSLEMLKGETKRMARLVNQMLELGHLETLLELERRPIDLLPLVEDVMRQVAPQAEEKEIEVSLEAEAALPPVLGAADRLHQVFLNLLENALLYSRRGDRVVISLRRVPEGVECVVRDTGPGIPREHLPHITRPFYRAAPQAVPGSGLGLAIVEEVLRRHGSRLEIESWTEGPETGTRVRFVLPVETNGNSEELVGS